MRAPLFALVPLLAACSPSVELIRDDDAGVLTVSIGGQEAFAYRYAAEFALPHVHPLRTPTGRSLLVQRTEPFPHHRSLWIADRVQLEGGSDVDFYHCWKNLRDAEHPELGHRAFIRHDAIPMMRVDAESAEFTVRATWIVDDDVPVLGDERRFVVRDLGDGEYLIDFSWQLRAEFGDVKFRSDAVHYAWPYLRMEPGFSGDSGGVLIDDQGRSGQKATDGRAARWIDYSNEIDGVTEGVAVFVYPHSEAPAWLTREYGTFGPRRAKAFSGTRFTLARGESLGGRVGILVHRGDSVTGKVAERYRAYVETR